MWNDYGLIVYDEEPAKESIAEMYLAPERLEVGSSEGIGEPEASVIGGASGVDMRFGTVGIDTGPDRGEPCPSGIDDGAGVCS